MKYEILEMCRSKFWLLTMKDNIDIKQIRIYYPPTFSGIVPKYSDKDYPELGNLILLKIIDIKDIESITVSKDSNDTYTINMTYEKHIIPEKDELGRGSTIATITESYSNVIIYYFYEEKIKLVPKRGSYTEYYNYKCRKCGKIISVKYDKKCGALDSYYGMCGSLKHGNCSLEENKNETVIFDKISRSSMPLNNAYVAEYDSEHKEIRIIEDNT